MKFKIPITLSDIEVLKKRSKGFVKFARSKKGKLDDYLKNSGEDIDRAGYLAICYRNFTLNFVILAIIFTSILALLKVNNFYLYGPGASFLFSLFIGMNQTYYPKIFSNKRTRNIEKNLISAMQDMLVQLNSGIPIFKILVNIANSDYGEVSVEFKKITNAINSGIGQIEAIENIGKANTSIYFRRVLWQISNGMRAGSDMSTVIEEGIKNLNEEQAIQIQSYGSKLNPLIMFYMLIAVILPALGITFLIIISSMIGMSSQIVKFLFFGVFAFILFVQIMFLGVIKSRRPSLI